MLSGLLAVAAVSLTGCPLLAKPERGGLAVEPTSLHFGAVTGAAHLSIELRNDDTDGFTWYGETDAAWLSLQPSRGELVADGTINVRATCSLEQMAEGNNSATIVFTAGDLEITVMVHAERAGNEGEDTAQEGDPEGETEPPLDEGAGPAPEGEGEIPTNEGDPTGEAESAAEGAEVGVPSEGQPQIEGETEGAGENEPDGETEPPLEGGLAIEGESEGEAESVLEDGEVGVPSEGQPQIEGETEGEGEPDGEAEPPLEGGLAIEGEPEGEAESVLEDGEVGVPSEGQPHIEGEGESLDGELVNEGEPEPFQEETIALPGGVPLVMVPLPAGTFQMGRYAGEQGSYDWEDPQHPVAFSSGFWLGKYEVTKRQWEAIMETTPWAGQSDVLYAPDSPAVYVSWNDAQDFVAALNVATSLAFRLPSEAEWEYACRATTTKRFYWGDDPTYTAIDNYAWWYGNAKQVGEAYAHVVGGKLANNWGLHDMTGNVWEWCEDDWHGSYSGAPADGSAWTDAPRASRVLRGGDWLYFRRFCRTAYRYSSPASHSGKNLGFRLARSYGTEGDVPRTTAFRGTSRAADEEVPGTQYSIIALRWGGCWMLEEKRER